jgi:hypothetical protein
MRWNAQDGSAQWLVTLFVSLFAGGVGWLVKHLAGRETAVVSLNLQGAQTDEIRARIRREDESAAVLGLKELAEQLRDERDYWKKDSAYWRERAEQDERKLLEEEMRKRLEPPPGKGN